MNPAADAPDVGMDRILGRTREVGGCMEWAGYAVEGKFPQIRVDSKCWPVRRLVWVLTRGATRSDLWVSNSCDNPLCVNPDHLVAHTRGKAMKGSVRTVAHRVKISNTKRQKSVLTMEMVREIRSSDDTNPVLAERYGVAAGYISHLRRGNAVWKEYVTPFAGLGART